MQHINDIAAKANIDLGALELYGKYKAKISLDFIESVKNNKKGKLIYITCITPTAAGEGKTLTSIGIAQAFGKLNKNALLCLREPSLGPVFGTKGGATGGGKSQLIPMEDINLHFTGDIHAITSAHNLMAAVIDNDIYRGNTKNIDINKPRWRRVLDMNDRSMRDILPSPEHSIYGLTGFDITASSEIMAIMALSNNFKDLKKRLSQIIVGYRKDKSPIKAEDYNIIGSQALLLKDALKPNLVQTLEGQPVFVHCGPFANIAHGNSSVIATKLGLALADYVITEGGFSTDLGAEKFFDIVCPTQNLRPDIAVLVCSIKALNLHGGATKKDFTYKNLEFLLEGLNHLRAHIDILKSFYIPIVVAINTFDRDDEEEINLVKTFCKDIGVRLAISRAYQDGGEGAVDLASEILKSLEKDRCDFKPLYTHEPSIRKKINLIAKNIYGADGVEYTSGALQDIEELNHGGFSDLPICMAKTQFSLSDNSVLTGVPKDWNLNIRQLKVSAGAGFIVSIAGNVMLMPGLPKLPAAYNIQLDDEGNVTGLK